MSHLKPVFSWLSVHNGCILMQSLSHWPSFPAGMQGKAGGDQLRSADIVLPCIALLPAPRRENITQTLNPTNQKKSIALEIF